MGTIRQPSKRNPMISEKQYREIQEEATEARSAYEQAKGALAQLESQLKKDFDCSTIEEAKKKLTRLEKEEKEATEIFNRKWKKYQKTWGSNEG